MWCDVMRWDVCDVVMCGVSVWCDVLVWCHKQLTVGSLSSATCPPIFMQLTGQNNGEIASPAFLLARKSN